MPTVKGKGGKKKHFGYDAAGMQQAQDYAQQTGGKMEMKPPKGKKKSRGK